MKEKPEQDAALFRQALEGVTPLAPASRIEPVRKPRRITIPTHSPAPIADDLSDHGAGDIALNEFLRPGLNRMTLRKLRRGAWPPQDALDLHGLDSDGARRLLMEFLHDATQRGLRCINVIHGKGWRSEGRDGILKTRTRHWLTQHPQVLAFCEAPQYAGGGGAVWVLLKSS
ncbi:putative DNA endonuclease SmrA [Sideroxyarcus emersonii]|uniref:DNA endonuclease SmrA n=1 Tax=Sideroxyarcus emersonii TaxID=2764705 RepID=A0AAN2C006_9PROT|nr:Smr/MutS family protein [Sideroxyarcus emersonii]BCK88643.1 putative DNA endonuclease SmrA [Sideroxyarcus emersonii]